MAIMSRQISRCTAWNLAVFCILSATCVSAEITVQVPPPKQAEYTADTGDFLPFEMLDACTTGDVAVIQQMLKKHPEYADGRSKQGESCLHVAGIMGQTAVTTTILEAGGDPNIRTTFEEGLRMHPLSWNVYGGHVETAAVLLEHGAAVNADIDNMYTKGQKVTPLDLVEEFTSAHVDENFHKMKELLLKYGAKRYKDLHKEPEGAAVGSDSDIDEL